MIRFLTNPIFWCGVAVNALASLSTAQIAVRGEQVYTMAGTPIQNGVILIRNGKIQRVGRASQVSIPDDYQIYTAKVVTPGLIDAHATVGLTGVLNQDQDQDQLDRTTPIQPELRALDAYNPQDPLVSWVRRFGVTTVHTGHAPGELISGQTILVKTVGQTVEDGLLRSPVAIAATLSSSARKSGGKSPGTRAKMMALLRAEFIRAREYRQRRNKTDSEKTPKRDLRLDALVQVLDQKIPLLITAQRAQDISNALRLAEEFDFNMILDGGAEAYLLPDEIKAAGIPVILHPSMARPTGDRENLSFETAALLKEAGIPVALQSGFEGYVPKVRVALFEAALTAANGLSFEEALATVTIDAARILNIADRIGSLEAGKDADVALYDGDPFEYTSHCIGVLINGRWIEQEPQ